MTNFPYYLKDKLSEKEFAALIKAVNAKADSTVSYYGVCLAVRSDLTKAAAIVDALRKNIKDTNALQDYIASVKTLYLADRNERQNVECSYDIKGNDTLLTTALNTVTANAHILLASLKATDVFALCKARKCLDDLKFFASVLKRDKTVYEKLGEQTENLILSKTPPSSRKFVPMYLSLVSLEAAENLAADFNNVFAALKRTRKNTDEIVFWSAKGLDVYGFCEQANALRDWAITKFSDGDGRFSPAVISEIIINN